VTLYQLAERLVGEVTERSGSATHPFIAWCHEMTMGQDVEDEVPWCSSFINRLAWFCRLPRSRSAAARSWLDVGVPVSIDQAQPGANDVVILKRGNGPQPGPEVFRAPGHVGIYMGVEGTRVRVLGGNQGNTVSLASFPLSSILGIRRLTT
jgi:uncharacterized protein (TIGR02594 family)